MATLSRDQIRAAVDLPTRRLHLDRWDGEVVVRAMPIASAAYTDYKNRPVDKKGTPPSAEEWNYRRMLGAAILSTLDDDGNRIFDWKDADWLREKHWLTVLEIATAAFELAGDDAPVEDRVARLVNDYGLDDVHAALEAVTASLSDDDGTSDDEDDDEPAGREDGAGDPLPPTSAS